MTLKDADTNQVLATRTARRDPVRHPRAGPRHAPLLDGRAIQSPPSQSETLTVQVVATTVDASGVGVSYTTIYPYRDGYRDSVTIL